MLKKQNGITLIALVITIIILLILAGVTISLTIGQNGILKHAENSVQEYNEGSAREKLEMALADAKIRKMTQGLADNELNNIIRNIGGVLLPKEDSSSNSQQVILDGLIFEVDRSVPKIVGEPSLAETPTTVDTISLEEARTITSETLADYIGTKVDYDPEGGGTWRVFYVEDSSNTFGDGQGTLYLKRDYDTTMTLTSYVNEGMTAKGLEMMKKLNPAWREYGTNKTKEATDTFVINEKAIAALCDTNNWTIYATGDARVTPNYAIGAAPIEMWTKAYNIYVGKYETSDDKVNCDMNNSNGYGWGLNGGSLSYSQSIDIDPSIDRSKVLCVSDYQWIASPNCYSNDATTGVTLSVVDCGYYYASYSGFTPVVSISP